MGRRQRVIGLLGGMSWESSAEYHRLDRPGWGLLDYDPGDTEQGVVDLQIPVENV